MNQLVLALIAIAWPIATFSATSGIKNYGPGVTDTEIKIGQTMPYSGPASAIGSGNHDQHQPNGLSTDRGDAVSAIRWASMEILRRSDDKVNESVQFQTVDLLA